MSTHHFSVPPGIRFRDERSRQNFDLAMSGKKNAAGFRPVVAITGRQPGVGKSLLASRILESGYGSALPCVPPRSARGWQRLLGGALKLGYLFLDDVEPPVVIPGCFWRPDLQVVLTGTNLELSEDLPGRALCIHLEAGEGPRKIESPESARVWRETVDWCDQRDESFDPQHVALADLAERLEKERNDARRVAEEAVGLLDSEGYEVNEVPWKA